MLHILLFLSVFCIGIILSFAQLPIYAFVVYQAIYFFNPTARWWSYGIPEIGYSFITVVVMAMLLFINYKNTKNNRIMALPVFRWLIFLLCIYAMNTFWAVFPDQHVESLILFVKTIITIGLAYKLCDSVLKLDYMLYGYIFGAWYISFYVFQTGRNSSGRVEGIGTVDSPDANGLAAAIVPSLVLALYYFWTASTKKGKAVFAVSGVFIANALVLINSRGAVLAAAVSLMYFMGALHFSKLQKKGQRKAVVIIMILGCLGGLRLLDDSFVERIKTIKNTEVNEEKETGATRTVFWLASLDVVADHPLGAGYRAFNYYSDEYLPMDMNTGNSRSRTVHSTWFEVLTEMGYLGFFVFMMMLYSCFSMTHECKKKTNNLESVDDYFKIIALEAAFIAFIVAMTFLNRSRAEILYWMVLFVSCAYNVYVMSRNDKKIS